MISCERDNDRIVLEFCDNGDGVPEELEERIFNAFFTTTTYGGDDPDEDLQGTGLGLKIVYDIVNGYEGEVYLMDPPENFTTCFVAELPAATQDIIDEYEL